MEHYDRFPREHEKSHRRHFLRLGGAIVGTRVLVSPYNWSVVRYVSKNPHIIILSAPSGLATTQSLGKGGPISFRGIRSIRLLSHTNAAMPKRYEFWGSKGQGLFLEPTALASRQSTTPPLRRPQPLGMSRTGNITEVRGHCRIGLLDSKTLSCLAYSAQDE